MRDSARLRHSFMVATVAIVTVSAFAARSAASTVTINDPDGSPMSSYVAPPSSSPETHIIGVYETRNDHSADYNPQGTANIHIQYDGSEPMRPWCWYFRVTRQPCGILTAHRT